MVRLRVNQDVFLVCISILVQVPLAIFLGHYYDQRIFLETGYLVNEGLNPYTQHAIDVFANPYLTGLNPIVGYPPPWPLFLGLIYHLTYNTVSNIFLYNFATKIPLITANIVLAYAVKTIMQRQNMPSRMVCFAWVFLLFNPFVLLTTTAWGQIDGVVAVLCVGAVYLLSQKQPLKSALLLAVGFVLKPITLPLLALPFLYSASNMRKNFQVLFIFAVTILALWFGSFYAMGWMIPSMPSEVTAHFSMAGGMTLFSFIDIFWRTAELPVDWWFMGYLWIPVLATGCVWVYRRAPKSMQDLTESGVVLILLFFLSRTWLSEPNLNLLLPFLLILMGFGTLRYRIFHLAWIIPIVFLLLNASIPQLFFLVYPPSISLKEMFDVEFGTIQLTARFIVTVLWSIVILGILYNLLSNNNRLKRNLNQPTINTKN
jgi:hypothetical protein